MKKLWKFFKYLVIVIVGVFIIDAGIVLFFARYRPPIQKADAIVILGAAINTPALYNRSLEGLRLYEAGDAPVIVLSGGQDFAGSMSEADYMEKVIDASSTVPVNLILEDQSHSTYENINNTKAKLGAGKSLIIVSDDYHIARAVLTALRAGFKPVYWSSPKTPNPDSRELEYYFREMLAMVDYIPRFIFG